MGNPPASVPPSLSTQHERLILELLPFKDTIQFHEWLNGIYVRGSWLEFCAAFPLAVARSLPEPDKTKTAQAAKDAISSRTAKYLLYHPDKTGWTSEDHAIRFIAAVVADNMLKGAWTESEFRKRGLEITKAVYEVLSFLRASAAVSSGAGPSDQPPRYMD